MQKHEVLLADADICVKCGLCLPHCPTYTKTRNENESPRGRIALIETAGQLAKINCSAFAEYNLDAILTIASGCGSQLQEYKQAEFAGKVMDISHFLSQSDCTLSEQLKPLTASVCLHTPCSLKNVMREEHGALRLVQQIPGIAITLLPETIQCCGSAGSYMLKHPKMAQALLADLLDVVLDPQPDYLLSSNIGCAMHIAAGLKERGVEMEVMHPIVLIARQLKG